MRLRLAGGATLAVALLCAGCGGSSSSSSSGDGLIAGFRPSPQAFFRLNAESTRHPADVRAAALAHLRDDDAASRWAAVYALGLTATHSAGAPELRRLLSSRSVDERILSAAALAGIGDRRGLQSLVGSLNDHRKLLYRDPPQSAAELADAELRALTGLDLSSPAWRSWWRAHASRARFDAATRRWSG
jgi:hypothetical protein